MSTVCLHSDFLWQVSKYDVELVPDLDPNSPYNFTTEGKVSLHLTTTQLATERTSIAMHAKQLKIMESEVTVEKIVKSNPDKNVPLNVIGHEYDKDREFYVIHLDQELEPNTDYVAFIPFLAILNDDLSGFYRRSVHTHWIGPFMKLILKKKYFSFPRIYKFVKLYLPNLILIYY